MRRARGRPVLLAAGVAAVLLAPAGGAPAQDAAAVTEVAPVASGAPSAPSAPSVVRGAVTGLPLPRYVTLKTSEGNARRGPGLGHRIDWVFTRAGMPLKVTAEHENWRRVEDADGAVGWIHYALLSGSRSVIVMQDMAEVRAAPDPRAEVVMQAELGVIARLLECRGGWCRLAAGGMRGWLPDRALWGVEPGETVD